MEVASAAPGLNFGVSDTVLFLIKAITRRIFNKRLAKGGWLARIMFIIGMVRWLDRRFNGSRIVHVKKNEKIVVTTESNRQ